LYLDAWNRNHSADFVAKGLAECAVAAQRHMVLVVVLTSLHSQEWLCHGEANSEDGGVTKGIKPLLQYSKSKQCRFTDICKPDGTNVF
jgi:hypothetical protein